MTTSPEPQRSVTDRARAAALWARDTGLGSFGFVIVLLVALSGWSASFIGLHGFGVDHMGFSDDAGWLVPLTFDGAPAGLSIVVMRAGIHGRNAIFWRALIIGFTLLSSWINYVHIDDDFGRLVAAFMPPSAVVLFEGLMSEVRAAAERRQESRRPLQLHPARWFFSPLGTIGIVRRWVLDMDLPEALAAAATARAVDEDPKPAIASQAPLAAVASQASARVPLPVRREAATARAASATPAAITGSSVYLPLAETPPATPAPATALPVSDLPTTVASPAATGNESAPTVGTASPGSKAAASGEQRDLDDVADTFRKLAAHLGKSPSDAALANALGVGRSRAQQLRTAAIAAGHNDLEKPLRTAS